MSIFPSWDPKEFIRKIIDENFLVSSPYIPFVNKAPVVAGTNGIAPIFLTTVGVTGGIGLDLKNWVKKVIAKMIAKDAIKSGVVKNV